MQELVSKLEKLKVSEVGMTVDERMSEFEEVNRASDRRWFSELSFCILTANCSAELVMEIQEELGSKGFIELDYESLRDELHEMGYRFYRIRAEYIVEAREYADKIKKVVTNFSNQKKAREWLTENVKGLGYKEGSHFLRNVGYKGLAILDRHILRILNEHEVIDEIPETLTKSKYLSIEDRAENLSKKADLPPGELDLYLWYMATGEVLK